MNGPAVLEELALLPLSLVFFGALFLITGVVRLSRVATEERKGEALLWGTVGVVLGVAFFAAAVAVVMWEPEDPRRYSPMP
jgi:hypothetical protein